MMRKNRNSYLAIVLLLSCTLAAVLANPEQAYSQSKKEEKSKKKRVLYLVSMGYHPDVMKIVSQGAMINFHNRKGKNKGKTAYCFLGYIDDDASGIVVRLKAGMLRYIEKEPKIIGLTFSGYTDNFCDQCPERINFKDEVLKDLPRLKYIKTLVFREIDFRKANRYKYIQPLKNLEWLRFQDCAVNFHKLITMTGPYPKLKVLKIEQWSTYGPFEKPEVTAARKIDLVTEKAMLKFVEGCPNLEELTLFFDHSTRFEYKAIQALFKLKKLKKLAIAGYSFGPIPLSKYPPEVIKQHVVLMKEIKKQLPECKDCDGVARGLIDWPGIGLPKPTVPPKKKQPK